MQGEQVILIDLLWHAGKEMVRGNDGCGRTNIRLKAVYPDFSVRFDPNYYTMPSWALGGQVIFETSGLT